MGQEVGAKVQGQWKYKQVSVAATGISRGKGMLIYYSNMIVLEQDCYSALTENLKHSLSTWPAFSDSTMTRIPKKAQFLEAMGLPLKHTLLVGESKTSIQVQREKHRKPPDGKRANAMLKKSLCQSQLIMGEEK